MVLAHLGLDMEEKQLEAILRTTPGGTTAADIQKIQRLGLDVNVHPSSLFELYDLLRKGVPCIVFLWTGNLEYWNIACWHTVVVIGFEENIIYVNDPFFSDAPQKADLHNFLNAWALCDFTLATIRKPNIGENS